VTVVPRGDQLDLSLEYDAALFTPARVTRWGRQLATVLELAAADPHITLAVLRQRIQHDAERLLRESADAHRKTVQAAFSTLRQARGAGVSPESRL
jgi:hypothetical protein